jgi:hypothetical protein
LRRRVPGPGEIERVLSESRPDSSAFTLTRTVRSEGNADSQIRELDDNRRALPPHAPALLRHAICRALAVMSGMKVAVSKPSMSRGGRALMAAFFRAVPAVLRPGGEVHVSHKTKVGFSLRLRLTGGRRCAPAAFDDSHSDKYDARRHPFATGKSKSSLRSPPLLRSLRAPAAATDVACSHRPRV